MELTMQMLFTIDTVFLKLIIFKDTIDKFMVTHFLYSNFIVLKINKTYDHFKQI